MTRMRVALCATLMAASGQAVIAHADPVTDNAMAGVSEGGFSYGEFPFGVTLDAERSTSGGTEGASSTSSRASLGDASMGNAGNVETSGSVTGPAVMGRFFDTSSTVQVSFSFSVNPLAGGLVLPAYPVKVHVMGQVEVSSEGTAYGGASATAAIENVKSYGVSFYAVDNASDQFDVVETLWLSSGVYRGYVQAGGWASASCAVAVENGPCVPSSASYRAFADPTFSFDQAAYDAEFGSDRPLILADHFRIDLSPNIPDGPTDLVVLTPVPEPGQGAYLLVGLLALAGLGSLRVRALPRSAMARPRPAPRDESSA